MAELPTEERQVILIRDAERRKDFKDVEREYGIDEERVKLLQQKAILPRERQETGGQSA